MFRRSEKRMRRTLDEQHLQNFLHRNVAIRWVILVVTLGILAAFTTMGGKYESADLVVEQISPRTIVARANFSYLDENATDRERDLRSKLSPNVYRLSLDAFQRNLLRTRHLMERVIQLGQGGKMDESQIQQIADIWNEGADLPLSASEVQSLIHVPGKKAFVENLSRLSTQLAEGGIIGDDQFSNLETAIKWDSHPEDFSKLRDAHAGQFLIVSQARHRLMETLSASMSFPKSTAKTLERVIAALVVPNLQLDLALSSKLQEKQRKSVESIYRNITKGNVLIERGERVTEDKLAMLKAHEKELEREFSSQSRWRQRTGILLLVSMVLGMAILVLEYQTSSDQTATNREYALLATITILHLGMCRLIVYLMDTLVIWSPSLTNAILPFCLGPMLVSILLNRRWAYVSAFGSSFLLGVIAQFSFPVMLTSLVSSLVGIHLLSPLRRRVRIFEAGLMAGIVAAAVMIVFGFMSDVPWIVIGQQSAAAIAAGFLVSLLINGLLPIFESLFKVTTDLRWLELGDLNHPLLRRMVVEAPGTYHHSLIVANLAERACEAIGAHALQARVCSYFHDIGKLDKPEYFCENQMGGENPHQDVTFNMSALIIMAHVKSGVDMAIQHRLNRTIIDTIQQHHGTSRIAYFYHLAKRNEEDAVLGSKLMRTNTNDVPRVNEETYRYPGPKPGTREIGIIGLADAVEGASRSMLKPTPQKIESMIREIIEDRYLDGQLDDCPLSVQELKQVMDSFSKTILSMMHTRVVYPKDEPNIDQPAPLASAVAS